MVVDNNQVMNLVQTVDQEEVVQVILDLLLVVLEIPHPLQLLKEQVEEMV